MQKYLKYFTDEFLTNIVREELQDAYEVAVEVPFGDDHEELLKCLRRVIQYYSNHEQFEEWCQLLQDREIREIGLRRQEDYFAEYERTMARAKTNGDIWDGLAENDNS